MLLFAFLPPVVRLVQWPTTPSFAGADRPFRVARGLQCEDLSRRAKPSRWRARRSANKRSTVPLRALTGRTIRGRLQYDPYYLPTWIQPLLRDSAPGRGTVQFQLHPLDCNTAITLPAILSATFKHHPRHDAAGGAVGPIAGSNATEQITGSKSPGRRSRDLRLF